MFKYNERFQLDYFLKSNKKKYADLNFISFSLVCPCECAVWKSKRAHLSVPVIPIGIPNSLLLVRLTLVTLGFQDHLNTPLILKRWGTGDIW